MKEIIKSKPIFRRLLAALALAMIFLYFFLVSFIEYPESAQHTVDQINGSILIIFGLIFRYFFPDSEQAEENQKALHHAEPPKPQQ